MKKIVSLLLVVLLAITLSTAVFAADITIDGGLTGETYDVYKIFDATSSDTNNDGKIDENDAVAYSIDSDSTEGAPVWSFFTSGLTAVNGVYTNSTYGLTFTPSASDTTVYFVSSTMDDTKAAKLAEDLKASISTLTNAKVGSITIEESGTNKLTVGTGYYFVNSSLGSLCSLATENSEQKIEEKNSIPTLTKTEMDSNAASITAAQITASTANMQVGDTVWYKIVVTDGKGTDKDLIVHDLMSPGLTLVENSIIVTKTVVVDETETTTQITSGSTTWSYGAESAPTGSAEGTTAFAVTIKGGVVATVGENETITIVYCAKMNKNAVPGTNETNTAWLEYSAQTGTQASVTALTYKFDVLKYDGSDEDKKQLAGAVFELRDGDEVVKLIKVSDTEYRVADATEISGTASSHKAADGTLATITAGPAVLVSDFVTVKNSNIVIKGVDKDSGDGTTPQVHNYTLVEIMAPEGYNLMSSATAVTLGDTALVVEIPNQAGTILPSTGGIGTTIFYILGGIFAVGAAVILIARKRVSE